MARRAEIQYINYYMSGSAAYQLETNPIKKNHAPQPKKRNQKKIVLHIDPMALAGIAVALVMFVLLIAGVVRLCAVQQQANQMRAYVVQLQQENANLHETYKAGYDLEEIRQIALARGMIPASQAQQVQLQVTLPETPQEPTAWENFVTFLTGLFA